MYYFNINNQQEHYTTNDQKDTNYQHIYFQKNKKQKGNVILYILYINLHI